MSRHWFDVATLKLDVATLRLDVSVDVTTLNFFVLFTLVNVTTLGIRCRDIDMMSQH